MATASRDGDRSGKNYSMTKLYQLGPEVRPIVDDRLTKASGDTFSKTMAIADRLASDDPAAARLFLFYQAELVARDQFVAARIPTTLSFNDSLAATVAMSLISMVVNAVGTRDFKDGLMDALREEGTDEGRAILVENIFHIYLQKLAAAASGNKGMSPGDLSRLAEDMTMEYIEELADAATAARAYSASLSPPLIFAPEDAIGAFSVDYAKSKIGDPNASRFLDRFEGTLMPRLIAWNMLRLHKYLSASDPGKTAFKVISELICHMSLLSFEDDPATAQDIVWMLASIAKATSGSAEAAMAAYKLARKYSSDTPSMRVMCHILVRTLSYEKDPDEIVKALERLESLAHYHEAVRESYALLARYVD